MFNIPNAIKVGGVTYTVKEVPTVDKSPSSLGVCNYVFNELEIKADMGRHRKEETFIHELTHAIFYEAGYNEQDEDMINRVGKVLYQVLKDNRWEGVK